VDSRGFACFTPIREDVWTVQTPQAFYYPLLRSAYDKLMESGETVTDDAMVVEKYGNTKVKMIKGDYGNIKITTPEDLDIAEVLYRRG
jgi:2-C-methyl-D-erythritol 4-phosphate cytidylyltransferase